MPITIIRDWEVSIRPCEFDNFARSSGPTRQGRHRHAEYRYLMQYLTATLAACSTSSTCPTTQYDAAQDAGHRRGHQQPQIFPVLDEARRIYRAPEAGPQRPPLPDAADAQPGHQAAVHLEPTVALSDLNLDYGCIPFDQMPFCTSLRAQPPLLGPRREPGPPDANHELLARRVKNNVEDHGMLYTPVADLEASATSTQLIATYNSKLYYKHTGRKLVQDKGQSSSGATRTTPSPSSRSSGAAASGIDGYQRPSSSGWHRRLAASTTRSRRSAQDPLRQSTSH